MGNSLLAKIAVEDRASQVRVAAIHHLVEKALLARIAVDDIENYVQFVARRRIEELTNAGRPAGPGPGDRVRDSATQKPTQTTSVASLPAEMGVMCDRCGTNFSDSDESGGCLIGSRTYCPSCAPSAMQMVSQHEIRAVCPQGMSFRQFVIQIRRTGEGGVAFIGRL